jgi:hypothetical protein
MNDREIYSKTDAGREEMRTRALQLSGALRNVLLLVDGNRSVLQLKELMAGGKASPDALEQLVTMGLIELAQAGPPPAADAAPPMPLADESVLSAPAPIQLVPPPRDMPLLEPAESAVTSGTTSAEAASERFNRLYTLMNELVSDYLGLRGYFMQLKIEKCSSAEELLGLQNELGTALAKVHGKEVATELMARISAAAR